MRRTPSIRWCVGVLGVLFLAVLLSPAESLTSSRELRPVLPIRLKSRTVEPVGGIEQAVHNAATKDPEGASYVYLQLQEQPTPEVRQSLGLRGIQLFDYIPDRTFVARMPNQFIIRSSSQGIQEPQVVFVGEIRPIDKMGFRVEDGNYDDYAKDLEGRVVLSVWFYDDVSYGAAAEAASRYGGFMGGKVRSMNMIRIGIHPEMIHEFLKEPVVRFASQASPPMVGLNDSNRANVSADTVQAAPYDLDGSGVSVLVFDAGLIDSHPDVNSRTVHLETGSVSSHATHVSGTVAGSGSLNPLYKGMAPGVDTIYSGFVDHCTPLCLYDNPTNLEMIYDMAHIDNGADINNNSIGSNVNPNGYDCSLEGDYESTAQLVDNIVCGSLGAPVVSVWAAGNERTGSARCGQYGTIGIAGTAKNNIVVGATNSNDDSVASFSSFGPTDDGRLRPDIVAPGCQVGSDGGVTSCTFTSSYLSFCGTSMSSPTTTGVLCLAMEQFKNLNPTEPGPLPSTWKALLAHTADDLLSAGPDYQTGYGRINAVSLVDKVTAGEFLEDSVGNNEVKTFLMVVGSSSPLRVTTSWCDPAASPLSDPTLVNNLDLELESPSGSIFSPWVLDPANPATAASTGVDNLNPMEQVFVASPQIGNWTVRVRGASVPQGPQEFSLVYDGVVAESDFLDLAITNIAVDYDPQVVGEQSGPGSIGQEMDVLVTMNNVGSLEIDSVSLSLQAFVDNGTVKNESQVVTDFFPAAGVQTLLPGQKSTIQMTFAAGVLDRCGTYTLVASHDGAALSAASGETGDQGASNNQVADYPDDENNANDGFSPDLLELDFASMALTVRAASVIIEDPLTERLKVNVDFDGLGPGGDMHHVKAFVDLADQNGEVIRLQVLVVERMGVRSDAMAEVNMKVRLDDIFPPLVPGVNYRVKLRIRDQGSGEFCASGLSSNTFEIQ